MCASRWLGLILIIFVGWPLLASDEKKPAEVKKPEDKKTTDAKKPAEKKPEEKKPEEKKPPEKKPEEKKPEEKKPEEKKPAEKEKPAPKEKLQRVGELSGKLRQLPEKGTVGLSLRIGNSWTEQTLPILDELIVRMVQPPPAFDDKGKVKRYTPKELDELKGPDRKLPGYKADNSDLKQGQYVTVQLMKKPGKPRNPRDKEEAAEYAPKVGLILIVRDP